MKTSLLYLGLVHGSCTELLILPGRLIEGIHEPLKVTLKERALPLQLSTVC